MIPAYSRKSALSVAAFISLLACLAILPGCFDEVGEHVEQNVPGVGKKGYLPESGEITGWKIFGKMKSYSASSLDELIGRQAQLFKDYDVKTTWVADYARNDNDKKPELAIETYQMTTPLAASGIYHHHRGKKLKNQGKPMDVGAEGVMTDRVLYFYKGLYFVKVIYTGDEKAMPDIAAIGRQIAEKIRGESKPPKGFEFLDVEGVDVKRSWVSEGNSLNMGFLPPGVFAKAPGAGDIADIFIIGHYDEAAADKTGRYLEQYLSLNALDYKVKETKDRRKIWMARDQTHGRIIATQHKAYIIGVCTPETFERAEVLLDRVIQRIGK